LQVQGTAISPAAWKLYDILGRTYADVSTNAGMGSCCKLPVKYNLPGRFCQGCASTKNNLDR